jgi:hypothetical protein
MILFLVMNEVLSEWSCALMHNHRSNAPRDGVRIADDEKPFQFR